MARPTRKARGARGSAHGGAPPARAAGSSLPTWFRGAAFVRWALALITLAGAALRFAALRFQPMVTGDGTEYIRFAEALARGQGFPSVLSPGYPVLIALSRVVISDRVGAAVAVSMLAGIALPVIVWTLARAGLGERGALVPALLCALHPELARHSAVTMSESAYIAALYLGLALLVAAVSWPRALAAGLALGLAYAIRPEAIVALLALAAAAIAGAVGGRVRPRHAWVAALGCALVVLACVGWFHQTLGAWTLTPKTAALHASSPDWRTSELRGADAGASATPVAKRLVAAARAWPANARMHGESLLWLWPWPLLLLSVWGLARRRGIETAALPYLLALPLLGLTQQMRFELPAIPALAVCAAVPALRERSRWVRAAAAGLALFGIVACAWAFSDAFRTPFEGGRKTERLAGEWLARVSQPGDAVADRKPFVAFYAQRTHRTLPTGSRDALLDQLVATRARWLVLQDYVAHRVRPELAPLLDSLGVRTRESRVEMVYGRADADDGSLAIFRVLQPGEKKTGAPPVVELVGFPDAPPTR